MEMEWPKWLRERARLDGEFLVVKWPRSRFQAPDNPDGLMRPDGDKFASFIDKLVTRLMHGWVHGYGFNKKYNYLERLSVEVGAYMLTGNREHLLNAANYCYLEFEKPQHAKAYFDPHAESVTRGKV